MTNLTISLDENLVKQARIKAIQEGTSLSAKIREFVASYAQPPSGTVPVVIPALPVSKAQGGLMPNINPDSHRSMLDAMDADQQAGRVS